MNYYNEFDHNAAEWLRQLIEDGLIPKGEVDERSITDVGATELLGYTQCHFFAGVGGWSLALRLAGWPDDRRVWTGSCPCQAFSTAGKQLGFADERDLWPVFANLIRECRPECVFGEQVEAAIKHGWLDRVYADLEAQGYAVGAHVLGAHSVGAPHRRYRLYWGGVSVADGKSVGRGICNAENIRKTAGEIDAFTDASRDGSGVANGEYERSTRREYRERSRYQEGLLEGDCVAVGVADGGGEQANGAEQGQYVPCEGLPCGGVADDHHERREERRLGIAVEENEQRETEEAGAELRSASSLPPWSSYRFVYCRDGKVRRIPAESLLFGVANGLPGELDGSGVESISETGGFPLTTQKEGRAMLLKGYGNAIVPQVAAEFVAAFMRGME